MKDMKVRFDDVTMEIYDDEISFYDNESKSFVEIPIKDFENMIAFYELSKKYKQATGGEISK